MQARRALAAIVSLSMLYSGATLLRAEDAKVEKKPSSTIPAEKDKGRHDQFMKDKEEQLKKGPIEVVFDGDSITDGWRGAKDIWQKAYGKYNPLNLGIGGDRTQHLLWRNDHNELDGLDPKVVVLMIGTNNGGDTVEDITAGVTAVVKSTHEKLPKAKILLLAIFPRSPKATDDIRVKLTKVNENLAKLDGTDNVKFLDIGPKFLEADGTLTKEVMPDFLHPNAKGYQIWADAITPTLEEMTK